MKSSNSPTYFAFLALGTFIMAVISFTGIFFSKTDLISRLITGSLWSLVTFGWLGQFFNSRIKQKGIN